MLCRLTSKQVAEWQAYAELEPFGSRHRDWHFGQMVAVVVNMFGAKNKKAFGARDFAKPNRLDYDRRLKGNAAKQSGQNIKEFFKMLKTMQKEDK
jgi:hypothetical protein